MKISDNASEITNLFGIVFKRAERNKTTNVKRSAAKAKTTSKKEHFNLILKKLIGKIIRTREKSINFSFINR